MNERLATSGLTSEDVFADAMMSAQYQMVQIGLNSISPDSSLEDINKMYADFTYKHCYEACAYTLQYILKNSPQDLFQHLLLVTGSSVPSQYGRWVTHT